MSFALDWLVLRGPADEAARDPGLADALAAWVGDRPLHIVDLGAGAGATHRALAPRLTNARWTLVDNDAALLDEAARRTGAATRLIDLAADPAAAIADADVVTASAFFDLVSADWLSRFAALLPPQAAVYAALTYDGRETWSPAPPHDGAAQDAFHAHMRRDKGLGQALGGDAPAAMAAALAGRKLSLAPSPWRLKARHRALIEALADGAAEAVAETGALDAAAVEAWRLSRRAAATAEVGHVDLLALPAA